MESKLRSAPQRPRTDPTLPRGQESMTYLTVGSSRGAGRRCVCRGLLTHLPDIGVGVVVGVNRVGPPVSGCEVVALRAQIGCRAEGGIIDIEWIRRSIPVPVPSYGLPRRRSELHRPHSTVPAGIPVQGTHVLVGNGGEPGTVKHRAHNAVAHLPLCNGLPPPAARITQSASGLMETFTAVVMATRYRFELSLRSRR